MIDRAIEKAILSEKEYVLIVCHNNNDRQEIGRKIRGHKDIASWDLTNSTFYLPNMKNPSKTIFLREIKGAKDCLCGIESSKLDTIIYNMKDFAYFALGAILEVGAK